ncbi:uncharacterized protein LOC132184990 [Corylus avellana]|uniref:uncharacterized protein LOC132184990 n=1 Tax=Corylus avellana TaxID=13451 RepID=UPI001E234DBF|nr:uncharacterized protein LOC132184990 [Corylus avellana]
MESSSSASKVQDPCYFLEAALRALLKCLGVETSKPQEDPPTTSQDDPPPSTTETQTSEVVASERALTVSAVPSRPSLSNGSGPQIN